MRVKPMRVREWLMASFFNEYFGVEAQKLEDKGALNVPIINDLPLFIVSGVFLAH